VARWWQHPDPAGGRAYRSTSNQRSLHDHPPRATTPAPSASDVQAALANLTAVITAARQQGTADQVDGPY
jgi:hypothetical protein